jgi:hypothetical protein
MKPVRSVSRRARRSEPFGTGMLVGLAIILSGVALVTRIFSSEEKGA